MGAVTSLNTVWFSLIGLLWAGYFVLEGFDFGVGIVAPLVARDELDRRLCVNAVGPVWDGNEVWLLVAGGATFAAFPVWYATLFSGFYLALFLILVALIVRGVSFEFRGKDPRVGWRTGWDWARFGGSLVPALLWGVAFTDILHGVSIGAGPEYRGGLIGLIHPIALLGGLTSLSLFSLHGANFLALKTDGDLRHRAVRLVRILTLPTVVLMAALLVWITLGRPSGSHPGTLPGAVPIVMALVAAGLVGTGGLLTGQGRHRRDGSAFACTAGGIILATGAAFAALFPRVMVSTQAGRSLTIWNAASAHETLLVMTIVAAIFTPFVLAYQAWSYWVFRQRLRAPVQHRPPSAAPEPSRPSPSPRPTRRLPPRPAAGS